MNQHPFPPKGNDPGGSSLLAELAGEATSKLKALQMAAEDHQARSLRLNAALDRLFQFFKLFARHSNDIAPAIQRRYHFDNKTVFTPLQWRDAFADLRKQDLTDAALLDHVLFRTTLVAPAPVQITRRWNQLDALKSELNVCGLRPLDDLDVLFRKRSREDVFEAWLAPDFALKIRFLGNYREGCIDVACNNLERFGPTSFRLEAEDVDQALLDDLGRYLIGRTDRLPAPFGGGVAPHPG
jgi:hypothetical protein